MRLSHLGTASLVAVSLGLLARDAHAAAPLPWEHLGKNLGDAFGPESLPYLSLAIVGTAVASPSGLDHGVRTFVAGNLSSKPFGDVAVWTGYVAPPLIAGALYFVGLGVHRKNPHVASMGAAALQAITVTFATTVILKFATGRPYPNHGGDPNSADVLEHPEWAREFRPFNLDGAWAWPSGHTAVSVSLAAAIAGYWSDAPWVAWLAYPFAAAIGVGMIVGAHHWASDVLAGAALGQSIGWNTGRSFRAGVKPGSASSEVALVPMMGEVRGIALTGAF